MSSTSATSLARQPATFMREQTAQVRDSISAVTRLTEQYFATLARAKATYFDGLKRITDAAAEETIDRMGTQPESQG